MSEKPRLSEEQAAQLILEAVRMKEAAGGSLNEEGLSWEYVVRAGREMGVDASLLEASLPAVSQDSGKTDTLLGVPIQLKKEYQWFSDLGTGGLAAVFSELEMRGSRAAEGVVQGRFESFFAVGQVMVRSHSGATTLTAKVNGLPTFVLIGMMIAMGFFVPVNARLSFGDPIPSGWWLILLVAMAAGYGLVFLINERSMKVAEERIARIKAILQKELARSQSTRQKLDVSQSEDSQLRESLGADGF